MLLQVFGVTKKFGGLTALNDITFHINKGEIFGLIGPNGAGKTTLVNVLVGATSFNSGKILFKDRNINSVPTYDIVRMGIARTYQIVKPFHGLTVKENVAVGALFGRTDKLSVSRALQEVEKTVNLVGLEDVESKYVTELPLAKLKKVELARALAMSPTLLLLDEVMAGLNLAEIDKMMNIIKQINKEGITILAIEHVMKAIMGISDRIMVLHNGHNIAVGSPKEICNDKEVIKAYLGSRYSQVFG